MLTLRYVPLAETSNSLSAGYTDEEVFLADWRLGTLRTWRNGSCKFLGATDNGTPIWSDLFDNRAAFEASLRPEPAAKPEPAKVAPETISITPTWEALLPYFILGLTNATGEGQRIAKEELRRMARAADLAVSLGHKTA